jgi:hypothetical protein
MTMRESLRINFVTGAARRYVADVEALAAVPGRLEAAVEGQTGAWFRTAGAEGAWSPARNIGHLIAYARQTHENIYRMAWMTDPLIKAPDDVAANEQHSWEARDQSRLLQWFTEPIAETVHLLKELPDSSWGRPGQSPLVGRRSIRQTVREAVRHMEEHIAQLEAARE